LEQSGAYDRSFSRADGHRGGRPPFIEEEVGPKKWALFNPARCTRGLAASDSRRYDPPHVFPEALAAKLPAAGGVYLMKRIG
jgi:hypothetical protein